jgi:CO dehydrogenase maturation factor
MEQGRPFAMADLSEGTTDALNDLRGALDARQRDWARYTRQAADFHVKNARAWASAAAGEDLTAQVDPDFTLGPTMLTAAAP